MSLTCHEEIWRVRVGQGCGEECQLYCTFSPVNVRAHFGKNSHTWMDRWTRETDRERELATDAGRSSWSDAAASFQSESADAAVRPDRCRHWLRDPVQLMACLPAGRPSTHHGVPNTPAGGRSAGRASCGRRGSPGLVSRINSDRRRRWRPCTAGGRRPVSSPRSSLPALGLVHSAAAAWLRGWLSTYRRSSRRTESVSTLTSPAPPSRPVSQSPAAFSHNPL